MWNKIVERYYYSLNDIVQLPSVPPRLGNIAEGINTPFTPLFFEQDGFYTFLANVMGGSLGSAFLEKFQDSPETIELFKTYIWPNYYKEPVCYIDKESVLWIPVEEPTEEEILAEFRDQIGKIAVWLKESSERYVILINLLEENKESLMKGMNSESLVTFNDTPQVVGDLESDQFISHLSKSKSTQDWGTPMQRIVEIQNGIRSYYSQWAAEFRQFIFIGGSV